MTKRLDAQMSNKSLAKVHKRVLEQYPYLAGIYESMLITDLKLPDRPIVYANDYFEKMTLYPKEYILGRNCRFLQGKHTNKETVKKIREAVFEGKELEVEILNYRKDGIAFWNNFLMLPVFKNKRTRYFVAIQKNVSFLKKAKDPTLWTPPEVCMFLEQRGFTDLALKCLECNVDGKAFLKFSLKDLVKLGMLHRKHLNTVLSLINEMKTKGEGVWQEEDKENSPEYTRDSSGAFDANSTNAVVDVRMPPQLQFWSKKEDSSTVAVKVYFSESIDVILMQKPFTLVQLKSKIAEMKQVDKVILRVLMDDGELKVLSTEDDLAVALEQEGTLKVLAKKDSLDLTALSSLMYEAANPTMLVSLVSVSELCVRTGFSSVLKEIAGETSYASNTKNKSALSSIFEKKTWIVSYMNRSMEQLVSVPASSVCGKPVKQLLPFVNFSDLKAACFSTYMMAGSLFFEKRQSDKLNYFIDNGHKVNLSASAIQPATFLVQVNIEPTEELAEEIAPTPRCQAEIEQEKINSQVNSQVGRPTTPRPDAEGHQDQLICDSSLELDSTDFSEDLMTLSETTVHNSSEGKAAGSPSPELISICEEVLVNSNKVGKELQLQQMEHFLLCYRMLRATPLDLIEALSNIYQHLKNMEGLVSQSDDWGAEKVLLRFLFRWVQLRPRDLISSSALQRFLQLAQEIATSNQCNQLKLRIIKEKQGRKKMSQQSVLRTEGSIPPQLCSSASTIQVKNFLVHTKAKHIAEALTTIDWLTFKEIQPEEFLNKNWQKEDKSLKAPNLTLMALHARNLTNWVAVRILDAADGEYSNAVTGVLRKKSAMELRVKMVEKLIEVANLLLNMNNFQSLGTILTALSQASISRLRSVWDRVSKYHLSLFHQMEELLSPKSNFSAYRKHLAQLTANQELAAKQSLAGQIAASGVVLSAAGQTDGNADAQSRSRSSTSYIVAAPCIPYIPVLLKDLFSVHEWCADQEDLSISAVEKVGQILSVVARMQDTSYKFVLAESVYHYVSKLKCDIHEDHLWACSTQVEK